ncbi:MAG: DUF4242 domain-containing protein [Ginsengibacter sp.]
MKIISALLTFASCSLISLHPFAQGKRTHPDVNDTGVKRLYIDVHRLGPGKVTYEDVAKAHAKDLAVEQKYGVDFIKYWVDEEKGLVYCLSSSGDSESIRKTHAEAHGLLPDHIYQVTDGQQAALKGGNTLFLDIHDLGAGNVTAKDVAAAHKKDLAVQQKYGVNFLNYWVDEKTGVVMCLSEAKDSNAVINTHKEAHGLIPVKVLAVKQGE